MLVLTRLINEQVLIGADVVVTVLSIRGDKVRIGIDAPRNVPVHREEVQKAIEREKRLGLEPRPKRRRYP